MTPNELFSLLERRASGPFRDWLWNNKAHILVLLGNWLEDLTEVARYKPAFKALGVSGDVTVCELCGKDDLRCTVVLQPLDADGEPNGDVVYFGRDCAARALGWQVSADRVERLLSGQAKITGEDAKRMMRLWTKMDNRTKNRLFDTGGPIPETYISGEVPVQVWNFDIAPHGPYPYGEGRKRFPYYNSWFNHAILHGWHRLGQTAPFNRYLWRVIT